MSHYMTALAMRQQGLKPATKIVLYWLADCHNSETGRCFPSLAFLCKKAEVGKTALVGHIDKLVELGLVERRKHKRDDGGWAATSYVLHLHDPLFGNDTPPCSENEQPLVRNANTNLGSNNLGSINQKNTKKDLFPKFYEVYPKKKARGAAEKAWEKAIKKTDPEKIIEAARNFAEHSKGKDKQFLPYPAKWLNQEQWDDELETDTKRTSTDYLNSLFNVDTKGITKQ